MKTLIYLNQDKLSPQGGPLGVGYYYYNEMKKRDEDQFDFLESSANDYIHKKGRDVTKHLPKWFNNIHRNIRRFIKLNRILNGKAECSKADFSKYNIIHFHETQDMFLERRNLENYTGKVILQSHSPLPFFMEKSLDIPKIYKILIKKFDEKFEQIDRYAFERADYLIFPCKEAEEPYIDNWKFYNEIKRKKESNYKYILTGIEPIYAKRNSQTVRDELSIPQDAFVVSYAGRHNTVKGYDLLKDFGSKFISESDDNYIVVAGRLGPISEPKAERWIEVGWTNDPHSYINASDVFILPNRVTYFDLVLLEVLSLGKVVVASRTGGNKYFEKQKVEGIFLYDTEEEAISLLNKIKGISKDERKRLGQKNREYYLENLTTDKMYDRYCSIIDDIMNSMK